MGKMQRSKGARGERELAKKISETFNCEAMRGRQYCGGPNSPDVITSIDDVHIECKRTERLALYDALHQSERDAGNDVPIVCHRKNKEDWVVIVKLDDLPRLTKILKKFVV